MEADRQSEFCPNLDNRIIQSAGQTRATQVAPTRRRQSTTKGVLYPGEGSVAISDLSRVHDCGRMKRAISLDSFILPALCIYTDAQGMPPVIIRGWRICLSHRYANIQTPVPVRVLGSSACPLDTAWTQCTNCFSWLVLNNAIA